jgi:hypothetical protein
MGETECRAAVVRLGMDLERRMQMVKASARESITSLKIRVGDPPKSQASCQVCSCPFGSGEEGIMRVVRCARCSVKYHETCFWRMLPLKEWIEYVQWAMETSEDEDDEEDEDEDEEQENEQGFEVVCAVCREKENA